MIGLDILQVKSLARQLASDNIETKRRAVTRAAALRTRSGADLLVTALKDRASIVRSLAAQALGTHGDRRAVEPLIGLLQDPVVAVRWAAAVSLGKLRDQRAIEPLLAVFNDSKSEVQPAAAQALAELVDSRSATALQKALNTDDPVMRNLAATGLLKMGFTPRMDGSRHSSHHRSAAPSWVV